MILYVCTKCGHWQDMTLIKYISDTIHAAFSMTPLPQNIVCPEGCGKMTLVTAEDRLFLLTKPSMIEPCQSLVVASCKALVEIKP